MNKLIIFKADGQSTPVSVRLEGNSLWLTQNQIAELFIPFFLRRHIPPSPTSFPRRRESRKL